MGRARFLLYTGFIINRAAMGRARFLFYTGFINRAAMGRARFLLCTGFIFFRRFFFVGNQTQTSTRPNRDRDFGSRNLGCLFIKSCRNINVQKMLRILFSLLCIKYFFFWSHRSVGLKGNLKTLKKVLRQPWNALMLQLSLSLYDKKDYFFFASLFRQKRRSLI